MTDAAADAASGAPHADGVSAAAPPPPPGAVPAAAAAAAATDAAAAAAAAAGALSLDDELAGDAAVGDGVSAEEAAAAKAAAAAESAARRAAEIVKQIEFYFSDENLPTDEFMLGKIRGNKQGWGALHTPPHVFVCECTRALLPPLGRAARAHASRAASRTRGTFRSPARWRVCAHRAPARPHRHRFRSLAPWT
jgi:hypothetical protein